MDAYKRKLIKEKEASDNKPAKHLKQSKAKSQAAKQKKPKAAKKILSNCSVNEKDDGEWICPICGGNWEESKTDWVRCTVCMSNMG